MKTIHCEVVIYTNCMGSLAQGEFPQENQKNIAQVLHPPDHHLRDIEEEWQPYCKLNIVGLCAIWMSLLETNPGIPRKCDMLLTTLECLLVKTGMKQLFDKKTRDINNNDMKDIAFCCIY